MTDFYFILFYFEMNYPFNKEARQIPLLLITLICFYFYFFLYFSPHPSAPLRDVYSQQTQTEGRK